MRPLNLRTVCLLALVLAACGRPEHTVEPTADASPTLMQESTRVATSTPTVTLTATARPTVTPMPTSTPTAAPTHTLVPAPTATAAPTALPTFTSITLNAEPALHEIPLEVVGQIGGHSSAVAVGRGRVYLGIGPRLVVLDGHSTSTDPQLVGQSEVLNGIVEDIHMVDNVAYVAAGEAGLVVLDVEDPSSIRLVSALSTQGTALSVFVQPASGLAYVVGDEGVGPDQSGWLSIFDVSLPEQPEWVASVEMPGPAHDVAVASRYVYVAYADGLLVMDVSEPQTPIKVADVEMLEYTRALVVVDDHAYVAGQGLAVFDLSDPAQPRWVSHFESRFPADAVAVRGQFVYLSDTFCEMGYCGSTIHVVDLSRPADPQEIGTWISKSAVEDLYVHEDKLYLASRQKGLQVVDASDPTTLDLLSEYATLESVEDVVVSDGFGYVSDEAQSGLRVLDLSNLANVRVRGTAESARWAGGYVVVDRIAYVPGWASGFRVFDVRDPDAPREAAMLELGQAEQAVLAGERAYLTMGYEGLTVLNVADPTQPRVLGGLPLEGLSEGLAVAGDRAYVTVDAGEGNALHVIDVANPSQMGESGRVALQGRASNVSLGPTGRYVYVAVVNCVYHQCSGGLQVVDIRDPRVPQTAAWVEVPGGVFDVAVTGEHAFLAAGGGGVWVLDVSDPEQPRAVGWRDTAGRARSIVLDGGRMYVADGQGGLLVLQASWSGLPPGLVYRLWDGLWMADAQGRSEWGAPDKGAILSPDAISLVRYDPTDQDPWLLDRKTGAEHRLAETPDLQECCFEWWPQRPDLLLFGSVARDAERGPGVMGYLTTVRLDGTGYRVLDAEHDVGPGGFALSPDGQTIAYGGGSKGWLYRWGVGSKPFDPADYGLADPKSLHIGSPAWSPGGTRLAWVVGGGLADDDSYQMAISVFGLEERTMSLVHPYVPIGIGGWPPAPAWSPDGRWLAFEAWAREPEQAGVWVMRIDGLLQSETYLGKGSTPTWNPGGLNLAFQSGAQEGEGGIWVVDGELSDPRPLGLPSSATLVGWVALGPGGSNVPPVTDGQLGRAPSNEPQITSFSALPAEVEPGDVVTLSWEATGDRATICPSSRYSLFTPDDCWPVSPSGTSTFTIPLETGGNRLIYLNLTVDAENATEPRIGQVSVALKCDLGWFFLDERPSGICPLDAIESHAAAQQFERGTMIWVEHVGRYVVLHDTPLDDEGRWRRVAYAQDPLDVEKETSADATAPRGLYAPTLGFGFVWRGDAAGSPGYRETLGWALAPEYRYETTWQCDDAPPSGGRSWQTCMLRGPEGEIIVLDPLDRWALWDQPAPD